MHPLSTIHGCTVHYEGLSTVHSDLSSVHRCIHCPLSMDALSIMKACPLSIQIFLMSTGPSTVHCWYCLSSQILLMSSPVIVPSTGQVSWSVLGLSFIWFGAVICNCPPDIPSSVQVHMSMLMSDMASSNKTIDTTTFIYMWTTFSNSGLLGTIENLSNCNGNTNTNYTQKTNFTFLKLLRHYAN